MEVLQALNIHKLYHIKDEIIEKASYLHAKTKEFGVEFASTLDIHNGEEVFKELMGIRDKVDINPHLFLMQKYNGNYIQIHTHPDESPFSLEDVEVFLNTEQIKVMIAIGSEGSLFLLSKQDNVQKANQYVIDHLMRNESKHVDSLNKFTLLYNLSKNPVYLDSWVMETHKNTLSKLGANFSRCKGVIK